MEVCSLKIIHYKSGTTDLENSENDSLCRCGLRIKKGTVVVISKPCTERTNFLAKAQY